MLTSCMKLIRVDRVDTANRMSKDMTFTDARITKHDYDFQDMSEHCLNGERMHEYLQEMRSFALDEFDRDAILVGELPGTDPETLKQYVLQPRRELSMTFDFDMMVSSSVLKASHQCSNELSELALLTSNRSLAGMITQMKLISTWYETLVKATCCRR